jgi:hypothetical protein
MSGITAGPDYFTRFLASNHDEDNAEIGEPPKSFADVAVFEGEEPQVLPARLKVKVENGALYMRLELLGLRTVIERSFAAACVRVSEETKRPVYRVKLA